MTQEFIRQFLYKLCWLYWSFALRGWTCVGRTNVLQQHLYLRHCARPQALWSWSFWASDVGRCTSCDQAFYQSLSSVWGGVQLGVRNASLCPLFCRTWLSSLCNRCNVDAGDRLISVNEVNLQGLSHATAIDVLQNAPDDVTLVVSQPKERLYKGESSNTRVAICNTFITSVFHCFSSLCWQNLLQVMFRFKQSLHWTHSSLGRNRS